MPSIDCVTTQLRTTNLPWLEDSFELSTYILIFGACFFSKFFNDLKESFIGLITRRRFRNLYGLRLLLLHCALPVSLSMNQTLNRFKR